MMSPQATCCALSVSFQIGPVCLAWPSTSPFLFGVMTTYGLVFEFVAWQIVCLSLLFPREASADARGNVASAPAVATASRREVGCDMGSSVTRGGSMAARYPVGDET